MTADKQTNRHLAQYEQMFVGRGDRQRLGFDAVRTRSFDVIWDAFAHVALPQQRDWPFSEFPSKFIDKLTF